MNVSCLLPSWIETGWDDRLYCAAYNPTWFWTELWALLGHDPLVHYTYTHHLPESKRNHSDWSGDGNAKHPSTGLCICRKYLTPRVQDEGSSVASVFQPIDVGVIPDSQARGAQEVGSIGYMVSSISVKLSPWIYCILCQNHRCRRYYHNILSES